MKSGAYCQALFKLASLDRRKLNFIALLCTAKNRPRHGFSANLALCARLLTPIVRAAGQD